MKLSSAINYMKADCGRMDPTLLSREVGSFTIDSRETAPGDVFLALSQPEYRDNGFNGDFEDSTQFVPAAFANGALACVVRRDRFRESRPLLEEFQQRLIFSDDAIVSLQRLAHNVYLEWNKAVVAITGSAGKTTVKEITSHLLSFHGRKVLKNEKNYNNGIGHPLTVLKLASDKSFDIAVLEMGMSTPMHEIERLCRITPPDVSAVLNVLPVHIEFLGSIENVANAKAEIIEGMKSGGTAVLNADDKLVVDMSRLSKGRTVTFGIDKNADVYARGMRSDRFGETRFSLFVNGEKAEVVLPLNGRHNILNALAAAAIGSCFGMGIGEIAEGLRSVKPPPQRGELLHFAAGFTVINDSYNSNPAALLSMIDMLGEGGNGTHRKIVVAGEMLELGADQELIHSDIGVAISSRGVDILIGVRGLARNMIDAAAASGLMQCEFAPDSETAGELLKNLVKAGDIVLIKGSRGVRTEKIINKLLETFELDKGCTM